MANKINNATVKKRYVFLLIVLIIIIITIIQNTNIKKTKYIVENNKIPRSFDGFVIAQISDLHNSEFGENNSQIISILKEDRPDMIAITGDLIDSNHTDFDIAITLIKSIKDIAPIYFVSGNHEAWIESEFEKFEKDLRNEGVHILRNENIKIENSGGTINLIGLEDPDFYGRGSYTADILLENLQNLIDLDEFNLLLSHRPELFEGYLKNKVDLVLSGHAHGGQFRLPFIGGLIAPNQGFLPRYDAGIFEKNNTKMIVSKGIGNSIIPIRFNNQPEVVYIKLKFGIGNW